MRRPACALSFAIAACGMWSCFDFRALSRCHGDAAADCEKPRPVSTCAKQISAGFAHTCAIRIDGTVWCWGQNLCGVLGTGEADSANRLIPTPVTVDGGSFVATAIA